MRVSRERNVELRWTGDAQSEGVDGLLERWMRIPVSKLDAVRSAIRRADGSQW